ncbi:MAG: RNase P subunit p30 family protein [Methanocellales archaeon]
MTAFYDLNVHALPECADSPRRLWLKAKQFGYNGIVIANHSDFYEQFPREEGILLGVEIKASIERELLSKIAAFRPKVDVLLVHASTEEINRIALGDSRVDILAHPEQAKGGINHVLAKIASENQVALEFNLNALIHARGGMRSRLLSNLKKNFELAKKFEAPIVLTSGARSHYDLRAPREMAALAGLFGMSRAEAFQSLSQVPERILRRSARIEVIE